MCTIPTVTVDMCPSNQRPTTTINHHSHGCRRQKWPYGPPHEAFRPASMRQINRWWPSSKQTHFLRRLEEFLVDCRLVLPPPAAMAMAASALVVPPVVFVAPPSSSLCPSPVSCYRPSPHSFVPIVFVSIDGIFVAADDVVIVAAAVLSTLPPRRTKRSICNHHLRPRPSPFLSSCKSPSATCLPPCIPHWYCKWQMWLSG